MQISLPTPSPCTPLVGFYTRFLLMCTAVHSLDTLQPSVTIFLSLLGYLWFFPLAPQFSCTHFKLSGTGLFPFISGVDLSKQRENFWKAASHFPFLLMVFSPCDHVCPFLSLPLTCPFPLHPSTQWELTCRLLFKLS